MSKTYDVEKLQPIAPTSSECALAWVRLWLRDRPDQENNWSDRTLDDMEYLAMLAIDAVVDITPIVRVAYYRPHVTAARLVRSDPERAESVSYDGMSKTKRTADQIADAILEQGAGFDSLIPPGLLLGGANDSILILGL